MFRSIRALVYFVELRIDEQGEKAGEGQGKDYEKIRVHNHYSTYCVLVCTNNYYRLYTLDAMEGAQNVYTIEGTPEYVMAPSAFNRTTTLDDGGM